MHKLISHLIRIHYLNLFNINNSHKKSHNSFNSAISIRNNVYYKKLLKGVHTMNKKILSIFIMVMALSLLGVSCNNKTTKPSTNTPTEKPDGGDQGDTKKDLGTLVPSSEVDFGTDIEFTADITKNVTINGISSEAKNITYTISSVSGLTGASEANFSYNGTTLTMKKDIAAAFTDDTQKTFKVKVKLSADGFKDGEVDITCKAKKKAEASGGDGSK
ncbi:hypothetical protein [uncultured Brachyspira sp.]|uniref:hypothetical protein n=1 Tax=uncultured Brachyspira sp. TaxID=221953 RepID=UPI002618ED96|nr:hypothetical protein [uncultured Brachyspira sp.]